MTEPWVRQLPVPNRQVFINNQSEFNSWITNIQPYDYCQINDGVLVGGTLESWQEGVVVKGIGHAKHDGIVNHQARNNWYMNMHNIYGAGTSMNIYWADDAVVNCVIEGDGINEHAVGVFVAGGGGSSKLLYGNIIRKKSDAVYIQNSAVGLDHIVHNYLGDCVPTPNSYSIHEYAQSPDRNNNVRYIQNVVANSNVLVGGQDQATLPLYNLMQENWFWQCASVKFNYKRPICMDLINNYFLKSCLEFLNFQGVGDGSNDPPVDEWSIVTGNKLYNPGGYHFKFQTSAYINGVRVDGTPRIRNVDIWDNNWYHGLFTGDIHAGGISKNLIMLPEWRTESQNAGKMFDNNSSNVPNPPVDQYWLIPNDYDPDRAMLVVWGIVNLNLPRWGQVSHITDPYNHMWEGQNNIPLGITDKLTTFIVRYIDTPPTCDLDEARRLLNEALANPNCKHRGVKNRIELALQEMEDC